MPLLTEGKVGGKKGKKDRRESLYSLITFDIFIAFLPGKWNKRTMFLITGRDLGKVLSM